MALTTRENVVAALKERRAELRAAGVRSLSLFGSVARGEARAGSDVDLLIDIDPHRKFSLIDLVTLKALLSDLLERPVDVTVRRNLRTDMRQAIQRDLIRIL